VIVHQENSLFRNQSKWFSCIPNEWNIVYDCSNGINENTGYCEYDLTDSWSEKKIG